MKTVADITSSSVNQPLTSRGIFNTVCTLNPLEALFLSLSDFLKLIWLHNVPNDKKCPEKAKCIDDRKKKHYVLEKKEIFKFKKCRRLDDNKKHHVPKKKEIFQSKVKRTNKHTKQSKVKRTNKHYVPEKKEIFQFKKCRGQASSKYF